MTLPTIKVQMQQNLLVPDDVTAFILAMNSQKYSEVQEGGAD